MGFFDSKSVLVTGTSGNKMFSEDIDPMKDAILKSIATGSNLALVPLSVNLAGYASRCNRLYDYGRNYFYRGLPDQTNVGVENADEAAAIVVARVEGIDVNQANIQSVEYGMPEVWRIAEEIDYRLKPVFGDRPDYNGNSIKGNIVTINYIDFGPYEIPAINGVVEGAECYIIKYVIGAKGPNNQRDIYFIYNPKSGIHPELASLGSNVSESGYFPIIPIRKGGADATLDPREFINIKDANGDLVYPKAYRETKIALKMLGIDLDDLIEGLGTTVEEAEKTIKVRGQTITFTAPEQTNVGLETVDEVFVMMAIDIQEKSQAGLAYLFEAFKDYQKDAKYDKAYFENQEAKGVASNITFQFPNRVTISDRIQAPLDGEPTFKSVMVAGLHFFYIETYDVTKTIGKVGTYESETVLGVSSYPNSEVYNFSHITFYKQKANGICEAVKVFGLQHYAGVAAFSLYVEKTLDMSVELDENGDKVDGGFFVPIKRSVLNKFYGATRSQICYHGTYMYVYSSDIQKIKWYQKASFGKFLRVVAVTLFVISLGGSSGITEVLLAIAEQILIQFAITGAINLLSEIFDIELLLILATVVAVTVGLNLDGMNNLLATSIELLDLVMIYGALITEAMSQTLEDIQEEMEKSRTEYAAWLEDNEDELEGIEDGFDTTYAEALLNRSKDIPFETPSAFYSRTIHSGNVGVKSLDLIENFVDNMLRLPTGRMI